MAGRSSVDSSRQNVLRLWPGVVAVLLQAVAKFVVPLVAPEAMILRAVVGLLAALAVFVWWAFFSRAARSERWGAIALMVVALVATSRIIHESIATAGMGITFPLLSVQVLSVALVMWAVATHRLADGPRLAAMVATVLLACGGWALLRIDGITGDGAPHFAWRWAETAEDRLLAGTGDEPETFSSDPAAAETGAEWPGFRGPGRDGKIRNLRIGTDWSVSPPVELWRRLIGPGWSSFAVRGSLVYTQEQRGDDEVVSCYHATTGEPVWKHRTPARFWDSHAGAGPRGTPTVSGDRVFALGATGIVNALDAVDGTIVWSRNAAADGGSKVPDWGFAGSPLVVDDLVIVATAGRLIAYDVANGEPRWLGPEGGDGYSSPHLLTLDGVAQVVLLSQAGATGVDPTDGTLLWKYSEPGFPIVQPALTADGDVLIAEVEMLPTGMRRIAVTRDSAGWVIEERWASIRLKPYFSDFVVHDGHAYGFDGGILACIDVENGERRWKGGRYGHGQLVVLSDQGVLLVVTEQGELALVEASPDGFTELARFPAVEGKTWNHPVVVGDVLLVRNDREMAAFRLPDAGADSPSTARWRGDRLLDVTQRP